MMMKHPAIAALWISAGLILPLGARAADTAIRETDELRIGFSPDGAKLAAREAKLELYRKVVAGDSSALKEWAELKGVQRAGILTELAITDEQTPARKQAIRELVNLPGSDDPENRATMALARVACAEKAPEMRGLATTALTARHDEAAPALLEAVAHHEKEEIRNNAAAAMRAFGGPRVFEVIIQHWRESCGPGPRNHIFQGEQRSYIGDYDVSGAVYKPVVRSFLTGVVLDTKIQHIEGDSYYYEIREVAPDDPNLPKNDVAAWQKWLEKARPALAADEKLKKAAAIAALKE
jgi:hypothetical protein